MHSSSVNMVSFRRRMAGVDFFVEKGTNRVIVNEVNTIPGITGISLYPKLWQASGLSMAE